jgi:hypothetical protein
MTHMVGEVLVCQLCGKEMLGKNRLRNHMMTHPKGQKFVSCDQCGKVLYEILFLFCDPCACIIFLPAFFKTEKKNCLIQNRVFCSRNLFAGF